MNEWTRTTLGHITEVCGGGTPNTKVPGYWGGDVPWLTPGELTKQEGCRVASTERRITPEGLAASSAKLLPEKTVLLTSRATVGAVGLASVPMATNQGFQSLIPTAEIDPYFLMCWVQANRTVFQSRASGSTFPEISGKKVRDIEIAVPPLPEQRRIVHLMESIDAHISALEEECRAADRSLASLRRTIFDDLDAPLVEARYAFDMLLGRQKAKQQNGPVRNYRYVRSANVAGGTPSYDDFKEMLATDKDVARFQLQVDDIVLVEGGSIGWAARWAPHGTEPVLFDKHIIRLRAKTSISIPEYALQWCHWARETGQFAREATGITIKALGFSRACSMKVPLPNVNHQIKSVAPLSALESVVREIKEETERLRELRASVLSSLLSQTIAIPEPYDALISAQEVAA